MGETTSMGKRPGGERLGGETTSMTRGNNGMGRNVPDSIAFTSDWTNAEGAPAV